MVGDKNHVVTVLNVHRCFSQFCCFSSCGMSCVLSAPVGPFPRREEFCAVCLGRISKIKPLTFSVTLTSDLFVTVKFGRLSPAHSCCQRVLGCRVTASSGRPHIGRMPSPSASLWLSVFFVCKNAVRILSPFFWPRFRGRKWALSKFE